MSRVSIPTLMSLEQYAYVMGQEPRHFQQVFSQEYWPVPVDMNSMWFQHPWQENGKACREDLAQAIAQAETLIAQAVGYKVAPDWECTEIHKYPARTYTPGGVLLQTNPIPGNFGRILNRPGTLRLNWRMFLGGGRRAIDLVEDEVPVVYDDPDGDGYDEVAEYTINGVDTSEWLEKEILVVPSGTNPVVEESIRFLTTVFAGDTIHGWGNSAQFVWPQLWDYANPIDGADPANYIDEVDIYRVYNSAEGNSYAPLEFGYNNYPSSTVPLPQLGVQYGVLQPYLPDSGIVSLKPATWDSTNSEWVSATLYSEPQLVRAWYCAGFDTDDQGRVRPPFARAIAALATALISKAEHTYGPPNNLMVYWQTLPAEMSYQQSICPWGPKNGAWEAYNMLRHLIQGDVGATSL